jgi:hypothetical protein
MEQNLTNNNEEVMEKVAEVTEEVVKVAPKSNKGLKIAGYGLAMAAGVLLCHFVVEPAASKIGDLIEEHKNKKSGIKVMVSEDGKIVDVDQDSDEDEEEN